MAETGLKPADQRRHRIVRHQLKLVTDEMSVEAEQRDSLSAAIERGELPQVR
jgi:hypothetical protein